MDIDELDEIDTFFFDLDRTLWNWKKPLIGAEDTIDSLREAGRNVYFHTDNSLLTREEYARKLTSMGIPAEKEDVLTSAHVLSELLSERGITEVYAIGESGLMDELDRKNIQVTEDAEVVVAGFDRQFSYNKLRRAMKILEQGELYVLSTEKTWRHGDSVLPHQGPINQTLAEFAEPKLVGKPSQLYRDFFREYFDYFPGRSMFLGDRLEDVETGNRLGMKSVAVMSGDIDQDALKNASEMQQPDYGLSSLYRLGRKII